MSNGMGVEKFVKDGTARTFVNCLQLKRVWMNSKLLLCPKLDDV